MSNLKTTAFVSMLVAFCLFTLGCGPAGTEPEDPSPGWDDSLEQQGEFQASLDSDWEWLGSTDALLDPVTRSENGLDKPLVPRELQAPPMWNDLVVRQAMWGTKGRPCALRCKADQVEQYLRCVKAGLEPEQFRTDAESDFDACMAMCLAPPWKEPPKGSHTASEPMSRGCVMECKDDALEAYQRCVEAGNAPVRCGHEVYFLYEDCLDECVLPPQTPAAGSTGRWCAEECKSNAKRAYLACLKAGYFPVMCRQLVHVAYYACLAGCEEPFDQTHGGTGPGDTDGLMDQPCPVGGCAVQDLKDSLLDPLDDRLWTQLDCDSCTFDCVGANATCEDVCNEHMQKAYLVCLVKGGGKELCEEQAQLDFRECMDACSPSA